MNNIEFRAWDKLQKKFIDNVCIILNGNSYILRINDKLNNKINEHYRKLGDDWHADYSVVDFTDWYAIENIEIDFFTGKEDKNNKKIFKNDIVVVPAGYGGDYEYEEYIGIIIWDESMNGFYIDALDGKNHGQDEFQWNELEIIGNKYEDEKLLKRYRSTKLLKILKSENDKKIY